jgi:hypothetical protein
MNHNHTIFTNKLQNLKQLTNMATIIYLLGLLALCIIGLYQIDIYEAKAKQNNGTAVRHRNIAVICGILCIILLLAFIVNRDEFFSKNQSKQLFYEKSNQMQNNSVRAISGIGPLTTDRVYYLNQSKTI